MKPAIIFLSGLAATAVGVFARSCAPQIPDALLTSWCGATPPSALASASHLHCGGCAMIVLGVALIALAAPLAFSAPQRFLKRVTA